MASRNCLSNLEKYLEPSFVAKYSYCYYLWEKLFGGTMLQNDTLFGGAVPPNNTLLSGTPDSEKK